MHTLPSLVIQSETDNHSMSFDSSKLVIKNVPSQAPMQWIEDGQHVFAILDACDSNVIAEKVYEASLPPIVSLYKGKAETELSAIAPYVTLCSSDTITWIEQNLYGSHWGYYWVTANSCNLHEMRKHLRNFLMVVGPVGQNLYFRFYDPRIIMPFLKASDSSQCNAFFGPCNLLLVEENRAMTSIALEKGSADTGKARRAIPIRLTQQHLETFVEDKRSRFVNDICRKVADKHAEDLARLSIGDDELPQVVKRGMLKSEGYGIFGAKDIEFFIICTLKLGIDFDTDEKLGWPKETFARADIDGTEKMDICFDKLTEHGIEADV
jgi:hypothetical protein